MRISDIFKCKYISYRGMFLMSVYYKADIVILQHSRLFASKYLISLCKHLFLQQPFNIWLQVILSCWKQNNLILRSRKIEYIKIINRLYSVMYWKKARKRLFKISMRFLNENYWNMNNLSDTMLLMFYSMSYFYIFTANNNNSLFCSFNIVIKKTVRNKFTI